MAAGSPWTQGCWLGQIQERNRLASPLTEADEPGARVRGAAALLIVHRVPAALLLTKVSSPAPTFPPEDNVSHQPT
jgi:hypothetical protein